jgi:hypothetical protein
LRRGGVCQEPKNVVSYGQDRGARRSTFGTDLCRNVVFRSDEQLGDGQACGEGVPHDHGTLDQERACAIAPGTAMKSPRCLYAGVLDAGEAIAR